MIDGLQLYLVSDGELYNNKSSRRYFYSKKSPWALRHDVYWVCVNVRRSLLRW